MGAVLKTALPLSLVASAMFYIGCADDQRLDSRSASSSSKDASKDFDLNYTAGSGTVEFGSNVPMDAVDAPVVLAQRLVGTDLIIVVRNKNNLMQKITYRADGSYSVGQALKSPADGLTSLVVSDGGAFPFQAIKTFYYITSIQADGSVLVFVPGTYSPQNKAKVAAVIYRNNGEISKTLVSGNQPIPTFFQLNSSGYGFVSAYDVIGSNLYFKNTSLTMIRKDLSNVASAFVPMQLAAGAITAKTRGVRNIPSLGKLFAFTDRDIFALTPVNNNISAEKRFSLSDSSGIDIGISSDKYYLVLTKKSIRRFLPTGVVDSQFGGAGEYILPVSGGTNAPKIWLERIQVVNKDTLLVVGRTITGGSGSLKIWRVIPK